MWYHVNNIKYTKYHCSVVILLFYMKPYTISIIISGIRDLPLWAQGDFTTTTRVLVVNLLNNSITTRL